MKKATVMGKLITRYVPSVTWGLWIAVALLMPGDSVQEVGHWFDLPEWLEPWVDRLGHWLEPWADKLVHFGLFLVLAFLVWRSLEGARGGSAALIGTLAVTLPYVVVLEVAQIWIPDRGWETLDVLAGLAGVVAALALLRLVRPPRASEIRLPKGEPGE
jgi:VanZ family protein